MEESKKPTKGQGDSSTTTTIDACVPLPIVPTSLNPNGSWQSRDSLGANDLYYTLSTVAQTLAGALAVLVAFVVVRLGRLDDIIAFGAATLRTKGGPFDEAWRRLLEHGADAMDTFYKEQTGNTLRVGGGWEAYDPAYRAARDRPVIKRRLYIALGFTVAALIVCFVALPFTPWISASPCATGAILGLAVVLGLICLWLYIRLIRAIVGGIKD